MSASPETPDPVSRVEFVDAEFQQSLLHAIHDATPDGILVVDGHGVIVSHNRRFVDIWEIPPERLTGARPGSAVGTADDPILRTVLDRVKDSAGFLARVQELYARPDLDDYSEIELKDGRTLERHSTMLRGAHDRYLGRVWFFRDVTARKKAESALEQLARHDPLTGIMNRRYFAERARQEFARARRHGMALTLVEFDIDHFKPINDRFGHAVGDEVLKAVCTASAAIIRESDLFARIGGEEFAVLLGSVDVRGACIFAERLRAVVARTTVRARGEEVACTISIGVTARRADDTPDSCLERADRAMYRAKQNGRNRVESDP